MSKVYVQLRDAGTIFHDSHQNVSITGDAEVEVSLTVKVLNAIKHGVLVKVAKVTTVEDLGAGTEGSDPSKDPEGVNTSGVVKDDLGNGTEGKGAEDAVNYTTYKRSDLIEILNTRGIEFKGNASNAELAALLAENDLENKA